MLEPAKVTARRDAERVAEELDEAQEVRSPPPHLAEPLRATTEIVALELGFPQLEDMGIIFADEIARWVAIRGDGLVDDDDDQWRHVVDGGWEDA